MSGPCRQRTAGGVGDQRNPRRRGGRDPVEQPGIEPRIRIVAGIGPGRRQDGCQTVARLGVQQHRQLAGDGVQIHHRRGLSGFGDAARERGHQGGGAAAGSARESRDLACVEMVGPVFGERGRRFAYRGGGDGFHEVIRDPVSQQRAAELRGVDRTDRDQRGLERADARQPAGGVLRLGDAVEIDERQAGGGFRGERPERGGKAAALDLDIVPGEAGAQFALGPGIRGEAARIEPS